SSELNSDARCVALHQDAGRIVPYQVTNPMDARHDDRKASGGGLKPNEAKRLIQRWQDKHIGCREEALGIVSRSEEPHRGSYVELLSQRGKAISIAGSNDP